MSNYKPDAPWKLGNIDGRNEDIDVFAREAASVSSLAIADSARLDEDGMTSAEARYEHQLYWDPCHIPLRYHRRPVAVDEDSTVETVLMILLLTELGRVMCDVMPESEVLSLYPAARLTRQAIAQSWTSLTQQEINNMRDAIKAEVRKQWVLSWSGEDDDEPSIGWVFREMALGSQQFLVVQVLSWPCHVCRRVLLRNPPTRSDSQGLTLEAIHHMGRHKWGSAKGPLGPAVNEVFGAHEGREEQCPYCKAVVRPEVVINSTLPPRLVFDEGWFDDATPSTHHLRKLEVSYRSITGELHKAVYKWEGCVQVVMDQLYVMWRMADERQLLFKASGDEEIMVMDHDYFDVSGADNYKTVMIVFKLVTDEVVVEGPGRTLRELHSRH